ncbi:interleukin-27 subunit beta [Polyodon spathula]|uniref:interleukin-27 subunit beta n=1 Tax=Polyodon spathula TaxID=7913 RepID=UPI001B7E9842|nr:interleukin-27 subunit beta [Polyodon spathula]
MRWCAVAVLLRVAGCSLAALPLDNAPSKPLVRCWSPSYPEKVLCSWTLERNTHLPTEVTATYSLGFKGKVQQCVRDPLDDSLCVIEEPELYSSLPYYINVSASNTAGRASTLLPFITENIVKPDPPINVTATPTPGRSRQLSLQWAPPPSWPLPQLFPLKYLVQYSWGVDKHSRTVGPYEETHCTLKGLRPRSSYTVRVSALDFIDNGEASEWSEPASANTT